MAAARRGSRRSVAAELFEQGHRFDFFQAVALLELMRPGASPVGASADAHAEPVLFEGSFGFGFPASDVVAIRPGETGESGRSAPPRLQAALLGLGGVHGPLPNAVSEMVLERMRSRDTGFRAFLDIFNHRLLALFYRLRRKARIGLGYEAPPRSPYARYLAALIGLGTPHLAGRLDVPDRSLFSHAGLLAGRGRSAHGLEAMLRYHFCLQIRVRPFKGGWFDLDETQITRLGQGNHGLGQNVVLGSRVWDQQSGVTVEIDFDTIERFRDFLPIGASYASLNALVRFYAGSEYEIFFKLRYVAADAPPRPLSARQGMLLGWTSWLGTRALGERIVWINARYGTTSPQGMGGTNVA
jgi:type VI secretion system protein ImpH